MKAIRQAQTRVVLDAYNIEEISYSRMNEMFNELADEFAIGFLDSIKEYERENGSRICFDERDSKELLEIYKKEKGL